MVVIRSDSATREDLITAVIKVSGVERRLKNTLRKQFTNVPAGQTIIKHGMAKLPELMVAVAERYNKHYTDEMLIACLDFYSSEAGKQIIDAQEAFEGDLQELVVAWVATAMKDSAKGMFQ